MVKVSEIKDRESLEEWLLDRPEDETKKFAISIAHRAAMRVLPVYWEWVETSEDAKERGLTSLPVLRCNLISGVARKMRTPEIREAATKATIPIASSDVGSSLAKAATDEAFKAADASIAASDTAIAASDVAVSPLVANSAAGDAAKTVFNAIQVANSDLWKQIRTDCAALENGDMLMAAPLWNGDENPFQKEWEVVRNSLPVVTPARSEETARGALPVDWSFWINWYQDALEGHEPKSWKMLEEIAGIGDNHPITEEDWEKGPKRVNFLIGEIQAKYAGTPVSQASVAEFTFDAARRWMEMVGFEEDVAHLRDPEKVQAFLDDTQELEDDFQDFVDFAIEASGQRNQVAVLVRASEKVLDELKRGKDKQHIRARRLVTLGGYLYSFSLEESKRAELGDTLLDMLDTNVARLRDVCRKHFAPSIERLAPLESLDIGDANPAEILEILRASLERVQSLDAQELAPLSSEARAVLNDMLDEVGEVEGAIGEARTEKHRENLRKRFVKGVGATSATIGRYIEKAKPHSEKAGKWVDQLIKNYKRWNTLADIIDWLEKLGGGGPPAG